MIKLNKLAQELAAARKDCIIVCDQRDLHAREVRRLSGLVMTHEQALKKLIEQKERDAQTINNLSEILRKAQGA